MQKLTSKLLLFSRYVIMALFLSILHITAIAQIPTVGIYQLYTHGDNIFDAGHYAHYIINPGSFYEVKIVPDKQLESYGLVYALVSLDTTKGNGTMKIAFLRDTVSKKAKEALHKSKPQSVFYPEGRPYFAQEFSIKGDSVTNESVSDAYFPAKADLKGKFIFSKSSGYGNCIAIVDEPERENITRYDSITKKYAYGSTYNFVQSFFTMSYGRQLPYKDLRYTFDRDNLPIYSTAKRKASIKSYFRNGEYIAIRTDSADWLAVDRIVIVADTERYYSEDAGVVEGPSKLNIISGWVKKEDLATDPWVKQNQQTKSFRFEVSGSDAGENASYDDKGAVNAIKIINKKTGQKQMIMNIGASLNGALRNVVQVQDCNFDGYQDMMVFNQNGGAGPNYSYNFYLYNPKNGQFEYNEELSDLSQVQVDTKNKIITCDWRNGAADHGGEQYTFINHQFTKISYWEQNGFRGYFTEETSGQLKDGKWIEQLYLGTDIAATKAAVYTNPDSTLQPKATLLQHDYALIKKENELWFDIEATDTGRHAVKGWIKKEAALPQQWIKKTAQTPLYQFETTDSTTVVAIKVIEKTTGKTVQILTGANNYAPADSLFQTGDYSFDGLSLGFRIKTNEEENGILYDYYLYNKVAGIFKRDTILSKLPDLVFDKSTKTIISTTIQKDYNDNQTTKQKNTYQVSKGTYQLIEQQISKSTDDSKPFEIRERKLVNGKWEEKTVAKTQ